MNLRINYIRKKKVKKSIWLIILGSIFEVISQSFSQLSQVDCFLDFLFQKFHFDFLIPKLILGNPDQNWYLFWQGFLQLLIWSRIRLVKILSIKPTIPKLLCNFESLLIKTLPNGTNENLSLFISNKIFLSKLFFDDYEKSLDSDRDSNRWNFLLGKHPD